jgi:hypothetical protein
MTSLQAAFLIATFHVAGARLGLPQVEEKALDATTLEKRPMPAASASADPSPMEGIRMEIRRRLSLFHACADAARRRGVADVRRLDPTWTIAPDGSIKAMKLENVMDLEMTACLARTGSRRFPVAPGMELTVSVPIVFVR